MSIKAYAVIYCCDREACLLATARTPQEAEDVMKKDFLEVFLDNDGTKEDFENDVGAGDSWGYNENCGAWLNGKHSTDHDWHIIELDISSQSKSNKFYEAVDEVCLNCGCTEKSCNHCPVRRTYEAVKRREERGAKVCAEN